MQKIYLFFSKKKEKTLFWGNRKGSVVVPRKKNEKALNFFSFFNFNGQLKFYIGNLIRDQMPLVQIQTQRGVGGKSSQSSSIGLKFIDIEMQKKSV